MVYLASCIVVGWAALFILPLVLLAAFGAFAVFAVELDKSLKPLVKFWKAL
jgi:uncharacterized iron-regulated membrane protein